LLPPVSGGKKGSRLDPISDVDRRLRALLLLLIWVLGSLSVRRLEDPAGEALALEHSHASRAALLLKLRVALTKSITKRAKRMEATDAASCPHHLKLR